MADSPQITSLKSVIEKFNSLDHEAFLRPNLGTASLSNDLQHKIDDLKAKFKVAIEVAPHVSNTLINNLQSQINYLINIMEQHSKKQEREYVNEKDQIRQEFNKHYDHILDLMPGFIAAQIESIGLLQRDYRNYVNQLKAQMESILDDAAKRAKEIEAKARQTAQKISIKEAQIQFAEARNDLKKQIIIWAFLSSVCLFLFFGFALIFYNSKKVILVENNAIQIAYYSALRITILLGIGTLAIYFLKIFRASLHMYNHNLHRQRVANCIAAFVESASTDQQRDMILSQLVDAVISFGNSGLISSEQDQISPQKMIIDNIMRGFSSSPK